MHIVVCDDDADDLNEVVDILSGIFAQNGTDYDLRKFMYSEELLAQVKEVDIAVLDISMDCLNGIELGRRLKISFPEVKIIYITSYMEYCIQAINEIHASSFLCKPIKREEIEKQIIPLLEAFNQKCGIEKVFYNICDLEGNEIPFLKLKLNDILYFEYIKSKRRIAIVLGNNKYEFSYIMKNLISELEIYGFAVNCRGSLVNLRHIVKIKGYSIYLDNGKMLTLAQKRAVEFKEKMNIFLHNII